MPFKKNQNNLRISLPPKKQTKMCTYSNAVSRAFSIFFCFKKCSHEKEHSPIYGHIYAKGCFYTR